MIYKSFFEIIGGHIWYNFWQTLPLFNDFAEEPIPPLTYMVTLLGVLFLLLLIPFVNKIYSGFNRAFKSWCYEHLRVIHIHSMELILPKRLIYSLVEMMKYVRSFIVFSLMLLSIILLGNVFPGTRRFVLSIFEQITIVLTNIWEAFVAYLPDLVALFVIIIITRYTLKFFRFVADGIKYNKILVSGLHADLVEPTYQLLRFLVLAFAIVAAFPYIPGSSSPVFKGISIFVGFLLSLGSTSLVSNIVAGIVLTYTRGLRVGDRVEIGNAVGDVIERNLLVTRIRTIKKVVITIPNGMVLNNHIKNYSSSINDQGLILNTTVTIGYDVPWRQVHQLLIDAAMNTPGILKQPQPFVLQTSLDDFYVSYELNAYTKDPSWMAVLYSRLHQKIQDHFTDAGVEIMSPGYMAYRNGNPITIPDDSYPDNGYTRFFRPRTIHEEDTRPISDHQ